MQDPTTTSELTIRRISEADATELRRLSELEGRSIPTAPVLAAEHAGRLIAAVSIAHPAEALADPFRPSERAVELLRFRVRQIPGSGRHPLLSRLRSLRARRSRGALAGSPPGAGGRMLQP